MIIIEELQKAPTTIQREAIVRIEDYRFKPLRTT